MEMFHCGYDFDKDHLNCGYDGKQLIMVDKNACFVVELATICQFVLGHYSFFS